MKRGQAFETMMLVISVIVALAILAVLLNIIGGIGGIGQGEPDKLMHDKLKDVSASYGCSAPTKATLKRGTTIFAKQVRGDIVSIQDKDVFNFQVDAQGLPGVTGTSGTVDNANLKAATLSSPEAQIIFVVCADPTGIQGKYKVCISNKDSSPTITGCTP